MSRVASVRRPSPPWRRRREMPEYGWLRLPEGRSSDISVKPAAYLPVYEELLGPLRRDSFTLLELGVWKGDSLAMWRNAFPLAAIVGIDLNPPELDLGRRVHVVAGDQSDTELFGRVRAEHAPDGFDVIIDDASHIGTLSARSLKTLYPQHLKPGGIYIIEDWGTGYLPDWPDGTAPSATVGAELLDLSPEHSEQVHLPSHDAGMVGLIKRLVDHTAAGTLTVHQPDRVDRPLPIEWMRIQDGLAILKKPAAAG